MKNLINKPRIVLGNTRVVLVLTQWNDTEISEVKNKTTGRWNPHGWYTRQGMTGHADLSQVAYLMYVRSGTDLWICWCCFRPLDVANVLPHSGHAWLRAP